MNSQIFGGANSGKTFALTVQEGETNVFLFVLFCYKCVNLNVNWKDSRGNNDHHSESERMPRSTVQPSFSLHSV